MTFSINALHNFPAKDYLSLTANPNMKVTFSQFGEDVVLHHLLLQKLGIQNGFYVDIGCYHPWQYSNTAFLNLAGWRGINVDANRDNIEQFKIARPNDINICCGVGKEAGHLTFYKFNPGAVSTFSVEVADKWQKENGWQLIGTETMQVKTINQLLSETLPPNQQIDYLNLDIEGLDESVVLSFDFEKWKPNVLSIEMHETNNNRLEENRVYQKLVACGYKLYSFNLVTYIFSV